MNKVDIQAIHEVLWLPRWRVKNVDHMDRPHVWASEVVLKLGGLTPLRHLKLLKACGHDCKKLNESTPIKRLYDMSLEKVCDVFGIYAKGKYPNPQRYALKDVDHVQSLLKQVRSDAMKEETAVSTTTDDTNSSNPSKGFGGKKVTKKTASKKATSKKATSKKTTSKKTATKKTATKKKVAKKKTGGNGKMGALGIIGGTKDWDAYDKIKEKMYKLNPEMKEPRAAVKVEIYEFVNGRRGKKVKPAQIEAEFESRRMAYMAVNTGMVVPA